MKYRYLQSSKFQDVAAKLRKDMTEVEKKLWSKLRSGRLNGYKFRRQFPMGNYIIDFYCSSHKLAIELDGSQHLDDNAQVNKDLKRDEYLRLQGISVLRFWNNEVNENLNEVTEKIIEILEK